jgi:hypothetical protein
MICNWEVYESFWGFTLALNRERPVDYFIKIIEGCLRAGRNKDTIEVDYENP